MKAPPRPTRTAFEQRGREAEMAGAAPTDVRSRGELESTTWLSESSQGGGTVLAVRSRGRFLLRASVNLRRTWPALAACVALAATILVAPPAGAELAPPWSGN